MSSDDAQWSWLKIYLNLVSLSWIIYLQKYVNKIHPSFYWWEQDWLNEVLVKQSSWLGWLWIPEWLPVIIKIYI